MTLPIDASFSLGGAEWQIQPVAPASDAAAASSGGGGFAGALGKAMESLQADQSAATQAVNGMVSGTEEDPTKAVMALEKAQLSMQLAGQVRTKALEAFSDIFHTQV